MNADTYAVAVPPPAPAAARLLDDCLADLHSLAVRPWRQDWYRSGHVYAQLGLRPAVEDLPIGTFSSGVLAAEAVRCHNQVHGYT